MASVLAQHHVKYFVAWKKVYDSQAGFRRSSGDLSNQIFHDAGDSNKVTLLFSGIRWQMQRNLHNLQN
jgi:hypothetical protein